MRFMCHTHRIQTTANYKIAIQNWELWMSKGQKHHQQGQWQEAISFFGCSFEIAQWLIETALNTDHQNTHLSKAERMMISGHSLAECFKQLNQKQLELDILIKVHNLLALTEQQLNKKHWLLDNYLAKSLTNIRQYMKRKTGQSNISHHQWDQYQLTLH